MDEASLSNAPNDIRILLAQDNENLYFGGAYYQGEGFAQKIQVKCDPRDRPASINGTDFSVVYGAYNVVERWSG